MAVKPLFSNPAETVYSELRSRENLSHLRKLYWSWWRHVYLKEWMLETQDIGEFKEMKYPKVWKSPILGFHFLITYL